MDGVLIDSEPVYIDNLKLLFDLNHVTYEEEEFNYIVCNSPENYDKFILTTWARSRDISEYPKAQEEFDKKYDKIDYKKALFPDTLSTVKALADRGCTHS